MQLNRNYIIQYLIDMVLLLKCKNIQKLGTIILFCK